MKKLILYSATLAIVLSSCKKEESKTETEIETGCGTPFNYSSGALVVNEGPWGGNGTLSHINFENDEVTSKVYEKANCDIPAGLFIQSVAANEGKGYVVVNGSAEIQIVDLTTFKHEKTLSLSYPRYMAFNEGKGYITNGTSEGKVFVIEGNNITDSINVAKGPESILSSGSNLIVANKGVYPDVDSTISIINADDNSVTNLHGWYKPNDIVEDKNGMIWVSCSGAASWETPGEVSPALIKIDLTTKTVVDTVIVGTPDESISKIAISPEQDVIYYYKSDGVYRYGIEGDYLADPAFITGATALYGLEVVPSTGDILVFDAKDYSSAGEVVKYNSSGTKLNTYEVGVSPNGAIIK